MSHGPRSLLWRFTLICFLAAAVIAFAQFIGWLDVDVPEEENGGAVTSHSDKGNTAEVVRIIDGDTIMVRNGTSTQSVRLLGIDAPEIDWPDTEGEEIEPECFGWEAREYLISLVGQRDVLLVADDTQPAFDRYDRRLAYVYVGDVLVNQALVENGYATELMVGDGYEFADEFKRLEAEAQAQQVGLWSACN